MNNSSLVFDSTFLYPYGMPMPGRQFNAGNYRFGFNGQEKDDEVYGTGNLNTAEFWQYDTRLGRRWNVDPVVKPWLSGYNCLSANPIIRVDPKGDDDYTVNKKGKIKFHKSTKDENDRLISTAGGKVKYDKKTGELLNNSISVKCGVLTNRTVLDDKTKSGFKYYGLKLSFGDDTKEGEKVFKFLADNTEVEWSLLETKLSDVGMKSELYTSHEEEQDEFGARRAERLSNLENVINIKHTHSHPYKTDRAQIGVASPEDKEFRDKVLKNLHGLTLPVDMKDYKAQFFIYQNFSTYEYTKN